MNNMNLCRVRHFLKLIRPLLADMTEFKAVCSYLISNSCYENAKTKSGTRVTHGSFEYAHTDAY